MKVYFLLYFLVIWTPLFCFGQNLSKSEKIEISEKLIVLLKDNYVLQDSVEFIIAKLKERYKTNDFNQDLGFQEYSSYLTKTLREITKDAHFAILYNPQLSDLLRAPNDENLDALNQALNALGGTKSVPASKRNFFFKKAEMLDGNIGYLKLEQMTLLEESKTTLDAAMAFLSNSDAFILDLRGNRGGAGGFIPYLMSYFFPRGKILLYRREMPAPAWDSTSYHYTYKELPGKRLDNIPIYILTNQMTGSAATNLAYTMQSFGRATIIGENTGSGYRGAHSGSLFYLPSGFVGLIPIGKVINARTNTNWRAKGVVPNIEIQSSEALDSAHLLALECLITRESNEELKLELRRILKEKSKSRTASMNSEDIQNFDQYIGSYAGGRTIWIENDKLMYLREEGMPLLLKYKEKHLYKISLPSNAIPSHPFPSVRFIIGPEGNVENILLVFDDEKNTQGPFKKLND